ncbi:hypothetical protein [Krasilnikovia sp. MM14-A1259]|uniref:hypothetical protein n=1 Tax=Krasilnikovia sp. MM14-A1259 TaxID=3373539 RepID=UPI00381EF8ED
MNQPFTTTTCTDCQATLRLSPCGCWTDDNDRRNCPGTLAAHEPARGVQPEICPKVQADECPREGA